MVLVVQAKKLATATPIEDGTYAAELTGIRHFASAYYERIGFDFTIKDGGFKGQKVMRSTAPQLMPQSKVAEVLLGILGLELTHAELLGGIDIKIAPRGRVRAQRLQGRAR